MAAPTVWKSLPTELRSTSVSRDTFKSRLKSHFYTDAYLHAILTDFEGREDAATCIRQQPS